VLQRGKLSLNINYLYTKSNVKAMVVITIDTKKDNKEDIKKIIRFLKNYLDDRFDEDDSEVSEGTFNLFDDPETYNDEKKDDDKKDISEEFQIKPIF